MFDHVMLRCSDRGASRAFYETVLDPIGHRLSHHTAGSDVWDGFLIAQAGRDRPVTKRLHLAFVTRAREDVDRFWQAGMDAGYRDDGAPGPRPEYSDDYYGGFLLDPDGNSAEAVWHGREREPGPIIDHLWIRVGDLDGTKRFYATIAPTLGLTLYGERPERFHVGAQDRSFALVTGTPTENVHVAFPAPDDETVREFHRIATEAGYTDNGGPGERPEYHPGYYGAFVLDPDGNNIEAVNHNR
jgi:catechol 2,3-dioxygenase-like lactoylglutathione lyase family enzyme